MVGGSIDCDLCIYSRLALLCVLRDCIFDIYICHVHLPQRGCEIRYVILARNCFRWQLFFYSPLLSIEKVADGLVVNSTIERSFNSSEWLNKNGDMIQIMVLQNYLFFGNATSVYNFIGTVFFRVADTTDESEHRKPKFLILDLSLVTGMDTSTVGVFSDIRNLCNSNKCKLFMSGMSQRVRSLLSLGGFNADTGVRSKRKLRFFQQLDTAVGKVRIIGYSWFHSSCVSFARFF
jgi:ABC-type transporter Mla MlaB component